MPLPPPHAAKRLWTELTSAGIVIDILVNNAGSGFYGNVKDQDPDALERMLQVNVVALTSLTRLALPGMQARRWGLLPEQGGLVSFSKGLARELKGSGVSVTALCPGPTDSSFEERSGAGRTILYKHLRKMTAAAVARAGYEGMRRQSTVVIPGLLPKILALAGELPPRRIAVEVNRLLLQET